MSCRKQFLLQIIHFEVKFYKRIYIQVFILCCSSFQLLLEHQKALEDHMQLK